MTADGITKFEFAACDRRRLCRNGARGRISASSWSRRNSCANTRCQGDPADRSNLSRSRVLREDAGRGADPSCCTGSLQLRAAGCSCPTRSTTFAAGRHSASKVLPHGGRDRHHPDDRLWHIALHALGRRFRAATTRGAAGPGRGRVSSTICRRCPGPTGCSLHSSRIEGTPRRSSIRDPGRLSASNGGASLHLRSRIAS